MNKKNKIIILAATVGVLAVATTGYFLSQGEKTIPTAELVINEDLVIENPVFAVTEMQKALGGGNLALGESIIDSNISKATDQAMADEMIYYFMEEAETYGNLLISSKPEVINYLRENKIKPENLERHMEKDEVPDYIKRIWIEMNDEMVEFRAGESEAYINENYLTRIIPNYNSIHDKYEQYLSEEMKDLIKMRSNVRWNYSKSYEGGFMPEVVAENLNHQHGFLTKYPESRYARRTRLEYQFQLQLYFGYIQGSQLFNEYDKTISSEAVKVFENASKQDGMLGEKAKSMVEGLKKSGNKMTPELLYIIEEITEVDGNNYSWYWNEILGVEVRFDGPGRLEYSEPLEESTIDPETGDVVDIVRFP